MQDFKLGEDIKRICSMMDNKYLSAEIAEYCIREIMEEDIKEKLGNLLETVQQTNHMDCCSVIRDVALDYQAKVKSLRDLERFPSLLPELFGSILNPLLNGMMYDNVVLLLQQRFHSVICDGYVNSNDVDNLLSFVLSHISRPMVFSIISRSLSAFVMSLSELPDLGCLIPLLQSILGKDTFVQFDLHREFETFFHQLQCIYFETNMLRMAAAYPNCNPPSNLHLTEFHCDKAYIEELDRILAQCREDKEVLELFVHIIWVCRAAGLHSHQISLLLQPLCERIRKREDWVNAMFLVMASEMNEMLENPKPLVEEEDEWDFNHFWNPAETQTNIDEFSFFIQITGDVTLFVNAVSNFFTKQLLLETEETENALVMEKLMLFVIRKLGRDVSSRLVGMLRDLRISRLFNTSFHNKIKASYDYSCSVVSRACWMVPTTQLISLPHSVLVQQSHIQRFFRKAYKNRHLNVIASHGSVDITVTLNNESHDVELSIMEYLVFSNIAQNRIWTVDALSEKIGISESMTLKLIHSLMDKNLAICTNQNPMQYRHVLYWGEKGLDIGTEQMQEQELLQDLLRFERFVVDMLNVNLDFSEKQLYRRLKMFLQGNNKFIYGENEFHILIEELKRKNVIYEENSILKLRQYFGCSSCYKHYKT